MQKIRNSVFETNSSSTHSICIAKDLTFKLPESLHFTFGEFGWECDTLNSIDDKASYLYTGMIANNKAQEFAKIVAILEAKGIQLQVEEAIWKDSSYTPGYKYVENGGHVDHSDELGVFIEDICSDEEKLLRYLFSPLSFIITGNDNDDEDVDINVDYEFDSYYKGN